MKMYPPRNPPCCLRGRWCQAAFAPCIYGLSHCLDYCPHPDMWCSVSSLFCLLSTGFPRLCLQTAYSRYPLPTDKYFWKWSAWASLHWYLAQSCVPQLFSLWFLLLQEKHPACYLKLGIQLLLSIPILLLYLQLSLFSPSGQRYVLLHYIHVI